MVAAVRAHLPPTSRVRGPQVLLALALHDDLYLHVLYPVLGALVIRSPIAPVGMGAELELAAAAQREVGAGILIAIENEVVNKTEARTKAYQWQKAQRYVLPGAVVLLAY